MVLAAGSKLLVCHRRLFNEDQPRFFVGVVKACEEGVAKVTGYSFTRDPSLGFVRKDDERTKIVALASGMVIVYELPAEVDVAQVRIEQPGGHSVVMTDGRSFRMDLAERQVRSAA